ncbi:MAG TPA: hypothetical protein PLT66_02455, partial [Bacillota bacterium]|nr:hypothetical protein [Bacillota bacterium]
MDYAVYQYPYKGNLLFCTFPVYKTMNSSRSYSYWFNIDTARGSSRKTITTSELDTTTMRIIPTYTGLDKVAQKGVVRIDQYRMYLNHDDYIEIANGGKVIVGQKYHISSGGDAYYFTATFNGNASIDTDNSAFVRITNAYIQATNVPYLKAGDVIKVGETYCAGQRSSGGYIFFRVPIGATIASDFECAAGGNSGDIFEIDLGGSVATKGTITIPAGETSAQIKIDIGCPQYTRAQTQFIVKLDNVTNAVLTGGASERSDLFTWSFTATTNDSGSYVPQYVHSKNVTGEGSNLLSGTSSTGMVLKVYKKLASEDDVFNKNTYSSGYKAYFSDFSSSNKVSVSIDEYGNVKFNSSSKGIYSPATQKIGLYLWDGNASTTPTLIYECDGDSLSAATFEGLDISKRTFTREALSGRSIYAIGTVTFGSAVDYSNVSLSSSDLVFTEASDKTNVTFTIPEGIYTSGQLVPITAHFDFPINLQQNNLVLWANNQFLTPAETAERSFNYTTAYGGSYVKKGEYSYIATFLYEVQEPDATTINIYGMKMADGSAVTT